MKKIQLIISVIAGLILASTHVPFYRMVGLASLASIIVPLVWNKISGVVAEKFASSKLVKVAHAAAQAAKSDEKED